MDRLDAARDRDGALSTRAKWTWTAALLALSAAAWLAFDRLPIGWRARRLAGLQGEAARLAARAERVAEFERERSRVAAGAVVFLGSSTVERYPLERSFPLAPVLDRGVGDEPVGELLERLATCLPAAPPAAVVVYAGAVDLRRLGREPAAIAADVARVCDEIARSAPGAPLCLLGILPERAPSPQAAARRAELDSRLAAIAAARGHAFVPTARPPLADESGRLAERFSSDDLHLNDEGYRVLSGWILAEGGAVARALRGER